MSDRAAVLVVEHDPTLADLFRIVLKAEGYEASAVLETPQTLGEVRRRQPDLLILDVAPAEARSSYTLLDRLRADPATAGTPVLVTATLEGLAERAMARGNATALLRKPFDLGEVQARVREALSERRRTG